jgi:hypothetical protein
MSGKVFDFYLNDQGIRYDLAAIFTKLGELLFVATTIIGMCADGKGTRDSHELLQQFYKWRSYMRPIRKSLFEHENHGPLVHMTYTIDKLSGKKLHLFTLNGCRHVAQHCHEGMLKPQYFIDRNCVTDDDGAKAFVNARRVHVFDAIDALSRILCERFEADKGRLEVNDYDLGQLTAYDLKLPVYDAGSSCYAKFTWPTYKGVSYNGGSLSSLFRMAASIGASAGGDCRISASLGGDCGSSASATLSGGDCGSSASVDCDGGSSDSTTGVVASVGDSKKTGFEIAFPTGPIIYLVPFSVSIVVHGLGELFPRPELIVTHNNEVLFDTPPLLAAAIGCSTEEAAAKLRDITKKEQRLYPVVGDLRTQPNEAIVFIF